MRARRATLLPVATVHPAWISGTVLVHSREDIRHWRKADRMQSDKQPRRHPSGGLRRLTWAEKHPHRRRTRLLPDAVWEQTPDGRWLVR